MRFELNLLINKDVQIVDTFYVRDPLIVPNNDHCIREGIKTFYIMDSFYIDSIDEQKEQYVASMMDKLPKGDLSFKEEDF